MTGELVPPPSYGAGGLANGRIGPEFMFLLCDRLDLPVRIIDRTQIYHWRECHYFVEVTTLADALGDCNGWKTGRHPALS